MLHHYWAKQVIVGSWVTESKELPLCSCVHTIGHEVIRSNPNEKMISCVPMAAVQVVYNITCPYHFLISRLMIARLVRVISLSPEVTSGVAFRYPVSSTLFLFSLSTLVISGTHLALHEYSTQNSSPLISEQYRFYYDMSHFRLPIFNPDLEAALEALNKFVQFDLRWAPDKFVQLSQDLQTLTLVLSFLKTGVTTLGSVLALFGFSSPNISIAAASSREKIKILASATQALQVDSPGPAGPAASLPRWPRRRQQQQQQDEVLVEVEKDEDEEDEEVKKKEQEEEEEKKKKEAEEGAEEEKDRTPGSLRQVLPLTLPGVLSFLDLAITALVMAHITALAFFGFPSPNTGIATAASEEVRVADGAQLGRQQPRQRTIV
jgi:hypothetical protein